MDGKVTSATELPPTVNTNRHPRSLYGNCNAWYATTPFDQRLNAGDFTVAGFFWWFYTIYSQYYVFAGRYTAAGSWDFLYENVAGVSNDLLFATPTQGVQAGMMPGFNHYAAQWHHIALTPELLT